MASFNEISVSSLARLVGTPDCPVLLDLRIDADFNADPQLIPGASRQSHLKLVELVAELRGKAVVVYCQKGLKISQGAAAILRTQGIQAETLEGGQFAWRDAKLAMVSACKLPPPDPSGRTLWVTRHRPKIDRIACPWLLRRFVDPTAQILFVAASQVTAVAERFNTALSSGDLATVEALLAADVLILESGGAERSREEYMGHHAVSDAAFLKGAHRQLLRQRARTAGEFAWVGTESELHAQKDGKPLTVQSTETMVLKQTADGWRIVHIHWSSRTRR